jgi:hypothetical protein
MRSRLCAIPELLMTFFEPVNPPPPTFDRERVPLPWEGGLGRTVYTDIDLGEGPEGLLGLRSLVVFPRVMTLSLVALFRQPLVQGPGTRGHNSPTFGPSISGEAVGTGIVLFGLRFSDGSRYRNLDERGSPSHLAGLRSASGGFTGEHEFWAPLPTPGELEVWAAWPAAKMPDTCTRLNATQIRESAAALRPPWT